MVLVQIFKVDGMSCENCKAHVERKISEIEGVDEVAVDLAAGEVSVSGQHISNDVIKNAVEKAGYIFKGKL